MTVMNVLSVGLFVVLVSVLVVVYRITQRKVDDAEGLCDVNERGERGVSVEGDVVGEV